MKPRIDPSNSGSLSHRRFTSLVQDLCKECGIADDQHVANGGNLVVRSAPMSHTGPRKWTSPRGKAPERVQQPGRGLLPARLNQWSGRGRLSPSFSSASCASISIAATSAIVTRRDVARVRMCS